jgi:signal transduction histidine kinase
MTDLYLAAFILSSFGMLYYAFKKAKRECQEEANERYRELQEKNIYLEHAAKIIRHDMHSGINTYIPRGVISLERRLPKEIINKYRIGPSLRLIKEGLEHTQEVYKGVYAFTDLVKKGKKITKIKIHLDETLKNFLDKTAYFDQVEINTQMIVEVNPSLFCTAIDNLVRNGLSYNDSKSKRIKIYSEGTDVVCVEDNGRGLSVEDFLLYCEPYTRKQGQVEIGSGLGLNIALSIFKEHNFRLVPEKIKTGTIMRIYLNEPDK